MWAKAQEQTKSGDAFMPAPINQPRMAYMPPAPVVAAAPVMPPVTALPPPTALQQPATGAASADDGSARPLRRFSFGGRSANTGAHTQHHHHNKQHQQQEGQQQQQQQQQQLQQQQHADFLVRAVAGGASVAQHASAAAAAAARLLALRRRGAAGAGGGPVGYDRDDDEFELAELRAALSRARASRATLAAESHRAEARRAALLRRLNAARAERGAAIAALYRLRVCGDGGGGGGGAGGGGTDDRADAGVWPEMSGARGHERLQRKATRTRAPRGAHGGGFQARRAVRSVSDSLFGGVGGAPFSGEPIVDTTSVVAEWPTCDL